MVKWAGINRSVIPSDGKPTPFRSELQGLSRSPCQINKNYIFRFHRWTVDSAYMLIDLWL